MTSKDALRLLETRCRFYAQDNDELQETYEAREKIEKDLEVLEILKNVFNYKSIQQFIDSMSKEQWLKIKEWYNDSL